MLSLGPIASQDADKVRILLEAATVAKLRLPSEPQIRRAITYLEAILHSDMAPVRVLGTLAEMYAIVGNKSKYDEYRERAIAYRDLHGELSDGVAEDLGVGTGTGKRSS